MYQSHYEYMKDFSQVIVVSDDERDADLESKLPKKNCRISKRSQGRSSEQSLKRFRPSLLQEPKLYRFIFERNHPGLVETLPSKIRNLSENEWIHQVIQRTITHPDEAAFQDHLEGWNSLHYALIRRHPTCVIKALIQIDSSTTLRTRRGSTALHIASYYKAPIEVLSMIIDKNERSLAQRNKCGDVPLDCALDALSSIKFCGQNDIKLVSLLFNACPDVILISESSFSEITENHNEVKNKLFSWIDYSVKNSDSSSTFCEIMKLVVDIMVFLRGARENVENSSLRQEFDSSLMTLRNIIISKEYSKYDGNIEWLKVQKLIASLGINECLN